MEEVLRTNDPVKLSYAQHLLAEAGIEGFVADQLFPQSRAISAHFRAG